MPWWAILQSEKSNGPRSYELDQSDLNVVLQMTTQAYYGHPTQPRSIHFQEWKGRIGRTSRTKFQPFSSTKTTIKIRNEEISTKLYPRLEFRQRHCYNQQTQVDWLYIYYQSYQSSAISPATFLREGLWEPQYFPARIGNAFYLVRNSRDTVDAASCQGTRWTCFEVVWGLQITFLYMGRFQKATVEVIRKCQHNDETKKITVFKKARWEGTDGSVPTITIFVGPTTSTWQHRRDCSYFAETIKDLLHAHHKSRNQEARSRMPSFVLLFSSLKTVCSVSVVRTVLWFWYRLHIEITTQMLGRNWDSV